MKVGDIVELVDTNPHPITGRPWGLRPNVQYPVKGTPYTVRALWEDDELDRVVLLLEEIHNPINPNNRLEYWFSAYRFRVVEFPPDFEEELQGIMKNDEIYIQL